jgi:hypothetical protein
VSDLKGLSDLHGLEELFRFVGTAAPSVQCCDPRPLCGNSPLPLRNERLGLENHFFKLCSRVAYHVKSIKPKCGCEFQKRASLTRCRRTLTTGLTAHKPGWGWGVWRLLDPWPNALRGVINLDLLSSALWADTATSYGAPSSAC